MKRLSKSATDISCKKKTHSSSPEEEELPPFGTPPNLSDGEGGDCAEDEDDDEKRPHSAASTTSVPAYPPHKPHGHGFLSLIRQRLTSHSRSQSRETSADRSGVASRGQTPDNLRRIAANMSSAAAGGTPPPPEVLRFRCNNNVIESGAAGANNNVEPLHSAAPAPPKPEVIRHHVTPMTSLPMALAQELELARLKEAENNKNTKSAQNCDSSKVGSAAAGGTTPAALNGNGNAAAVRPSPPPGAPPAPPSDMKKKPPPVQVFNKATRPKKIQPSSRIALVYQSFCSPTRADRL